MKAAQIDNYGDITDIQIRDADQPIITDDQVLIEATAASINPFDLSVLSGGAVAMAPLHFPATLGLDMAGTIAEVGNNVTGFAVGDRVYGTANAMFGASGAFAEYVAANAGSVALSPRNISDEEAASLPTAGISGLQAIDTLAIEPGQKVFIHGGAGGAGSVAIQVAKARGAYVAATASTDNVEFVQSLGADEVIDYKSQNYVDVVKDYDAAFNMVRSENMDDVLLSVKQGGKAVSLVGPFSEDAAAERNIEASAQGTQVTTQRLDELRELIESGKVKPVVDKTFSLDQIQDVYATLKNESIKGKITVHIN